MAQDRGRLHRTYLFQNGFVALVAFLFFVSSLSFWFDPNQLGRALPHVPPYDYFWNGCYLLGSATVLYGFFSRRPGIEAAGHVVVVPGLVLNFIIVALILGFHANAILTLVFALAAGARAYGLLRGWQEADDA